MANTQENRICKQCKQSMSNGFVIHEGEEYYCSSTCLEKNYTEEAYKGLFEQKEAYWTSWENEEANFKEPVKTYFIFCDLDVKHKLLNEKELTREDKENFALFVHIEGQTTIHDILNAFESWNNYAEITEAEYFNFYTL